MPLRHAMPLDYAAAIYSYTSVSCCHCRYYYGFAIRHRHAVFTLLRRRC